VPAGQAVPESDLDFAILVSPETNAGKRNDMYAAWHTYPIATGDLKIKNRIGMLTFIWIS